MLYAASAAASAWAPGCTGGGNTCGTRDTNGGASPSPGLGIVSRVRLRTYVAMRRSAAATEPSVGAAGARGTSPSTSSMVRPRSGTGGMWGDRAPSQ